MATCRDIATTGVVALDGELPAEVAEDLAAHVRDCAECSAYLGQVSATAGIVAMRLNARDADSNGELEADSSLALDAVEDEQQAARRTHRLLTALALAADPQHADDLVQDTWQHLLEQAPSGAAPTRAELSEHLLRHVRQHGHDDEVDHDSWANAMLSRGRTADGVVRGTVREGEPPTADFNDAVSARSVEHLDPDSERAELYFPDFYEDGPDADTWVAPPSRWPTISHIVGPDADLETNELYSELDNAIGELPEHAWDAVHLIDLEGHTLESASWLLGVDREVALSSLSTGRNHLRGRIDAFMAGRDS